MPSRWFRRLGFLMLLLITTGCERQLSRSIELDRFDHGEGRRVMAHDLDATWDQIEVRLAIRLRAGSAQFQLRDPEGTVRWEETLEANVRRRERRRFPSIDGDWTATVELDEATGSYAVQLLGVRQRS